MPRAFGLRISQGDGLGDFAAVDEEVDDAAGKKPSCEYAQPVTGYLVQAVPPGPVPGRQQREQQRQKLIKRHGEEVVEPGLAAARHALLLQPVPQRTDHAAGPAAGIGEDGGVQDKEDAVEDGGGDEPASFVPPEADENGDEEGENEEDAGAHQAGGEEGGVAGAIRDAGEEEL